MVWEDVPQMCKSWAMETGLLLESMKMALGEIPSGQDQGVRGEATGSCVWCLVLSGVSGLASWLARSWPCTPNPLYCV